VSVIKGKLIKGVGGIYTVSKNRVNYKCFARGKIKDDTGLIIGDNVEFFESDNSYYIEKVYDRKNSLIRPKIANIDQLVIVIAKTPKPDFLLVDKLIMTAYLYDIKTLLCINKNDLANADFIENIRKQYVNVVDEIISVSALKINGLEELNIALSNKFSVFAGQSAVGKSTILNSLKPELDLKTDVLSKKTERGKHTTRHTEIFETEENSFIADTPGFSLLDIFDLNPQKLHELYVDFDAYRGSCKYRTCNHINNPEVDCGVKKAITNFELHTDRYNRYVELYKQLKEKWENKYG
jgi:ribosome biogenesis GTPase